MDDVEGFGFEMPPAKTEGIEMKRAYVDISLEALADLLMVSFDPHRCEIEKFEQSPKYENCIRLHLIGDGLPVEDIPFVEADLSSDETPNIKLYYTKEWIELDDKRIAQKTKLEIVPGSVDMRMVKLSNLTLSNKGE